METAGAVIGTLVLVAALFGFVRSLWRPPGKSGGNGGHGTTPGENHSDYASGGPENADAGHH
jgi:hypothetical protein